MTPTAETSRTSASFLRVEDVDAAARVLLGHGQGHANETALRYRTDLSARKLAPATVNRRLAAVRSLVKLARLLGLVPWKLEVQSVKSERYRDTKGPGRGGVVRLFGALEGQTTQKAVRDVALLHLLYDLALRRGEAVALNVEDVDLEARDRVRDREGPDGAGETHAPGANEGRPRGLARRERPESWSPVRLLRPGEEGDTPHGAERGADRGGDRGARQVGPVRPHGLRHAAITEALNLTRGNVRAVQRFSRHRDLRVLMVYDDNREDLGGEVARLVAAATV